MGDTDDCCRTPCNGGDSCCSSSNICREGEGDCDSNNDCLGDLVCGRENCGGGPTFEALDDCCRTPCNGDDSCCSWTLCHEGEGDCDVDDECIGDLKCGSNN